MITHHTQLLNDLIEKHNLKSYLEIGVQNPANNFDKIVCDYKIGVDPDVNGIGIYMGTSDNYFSMLDSLDVRYIPFDLIFIDGLHRAGQVKHDFENSLRYLSDNGFILIHDVLPENEEGTVVPRQTKRWWGDVYKFAMTMEQYSGIDFKTFNIDEGCMLIWRDEAKRGNDSAVAIEWSTYVNCADGLLRITDTVEI